MNLDIRQDESEDFAKLLKNRKLNFAIGMHEKEELHYVYKIILQLLKHFEITPVYKSVIMLFEETFSNHAKGYAKRILFEKNKSRCDTEKEYQEAIQYFSDEVILNWSEFCNTFDPELYKTQVTLQLRKKYICFYFKSKYELLTWEKKRIIERHKAFFSFGAALEKSNKLLDTSEGGGLGIFMILRVLKDIGAFPRAYKTCSYNGNTYSYCCLPCSKIIKHIKHIKHIGSKKKLILN